MRATIITVIAVWMLLAGATACAQDLVRVRFHSGYPPPDGSSEFLELSVSRVGAAVRGREVSVDEYFKAVRKILAENQVPENWGSVVPDGPFVKVEIVLGDSNFVLANTYDSGRVILHLNATDGDKRVARALQALLNLTIDQARERLSSK